MNNEEEKFSKKFEKIRIKLEEKNRAFKKLSRPQKRVAIAKDALKWLNNGIYSAQEGVYCAVRRTGTYYAEGNEQVNVLIANENVNCQVCAKGALLMSHIMFTNKVSLSESHYFGDSDAIQNRLKNVFSKSQLDLIETAFEKDVIRYRNKYLINSKGNYTKVASKAIRFGEKYKEDQSRLVAILKNIVKNKGQFIP
jgi:hypothetical protein